MIRCDEAMRKWRRHLWGNTRKHIIIRCDIIWYDVMWCDVIMCAMAWGPARLAVHWQLQTHSVIKANKMTSSIKFHHQTGAKLSSSTHTHTHHIWSMKLLRYMNRSHTSIILARKNRDEHTRSHTRSHTTNPAHVYRTTGLIGLSSSTVFFGFLSPLNVSLWDDDDVLLLLCLLSIWLLVV